MNENTIITHFTDNADTTYKLGVQFGEQLKGGETILMLGEAGAGKTVFTKGIAEALGIKSRVTSPTFALKNQYTDGRLTLNHLDMYRIEDEDEAYESGALDDISTADTVTIVEWAENVIDFFDFPHTRIYIDYKGAEKREIKIVEVK